MVEKHQTMEDSKFCVDEDVEKIKVLVDTWKTRLAVVLGVSKEVQVPPGLLELCLERVEVLGLGLEDLPSSLVLRLGGWSGEREVLLLGRMGLLNRAVARIRNVL